MRQRKDGNVFGVVPGFAFSEFIAQICMTSILTPKVIGAVHVLAPLSIFLLEVSEKKDDIYNILWALVFGFATLNILGLVARRLEPSHNRLSFGEMIAIMVVAVSVLLLGWEMLYLFKVLPIKLEPR